MAVCTKDQFARTHIIFDHDLMTYAFTFPEINVVCFCKISHFFLRRCCFRAVRRYVMVHDKYKFLCICNVRIFQFIVIHINSQMCRSVVTHQAVKLYGMDIARLYTLYSGCCCNDFFCDCHSHGYFSSLFSEAIRPP